MYFIDPQKHARRAFLRRASALSLSTTALPFALNLAALGEASAFDATGYKALVCVFLYGGNDYANTVMAYDVPSYDAYFGVRGIGPTQIGTSIAIPKASLTATLLMPNAAPQVHLNTAIPDRQYALHPSMTGMAKLFNNGKAAVQLNVGPLVAPLTKAQYLSANRKVNPIPPKLFSHNDQQSTWQALSTEGARTGWGGRFADLMAGMNGGNTLFTAISTAGNAVFLSGQSIVQYQLSTGTQPAVVITGQQGNSLFGSSLAPSRVRDLITDTNLTNNFAADYSTLVARSLSAATNVNTAFTQGIVTGIQTAPAYTNPITTQVETNSLALQLQTVARMIAAAPGLGVRRQVFFVSLGGWDTHDFQNTTQSNLLAKVAHAFAYFDGALANVGGLDRRAQVTTFTASDFSRTITTNGDGTDHAWGGHHFIMGGAVKGQDIYGQFPTIGPDVGGFNNPDNITGFQIPTTSVDQYGATLGRWFGASESELDVIFPRLGGFQSRNLGFL